MQTFFTQRRRIQVKKFQQHPILKKYIETESSSCTDLETLNPTSKNADKTDNNESEKEVPDDDFEWTLETFALNSCLCDLEKMLAEENTSLLNFGLPEPDMQKEQYIQNCLMDHYVASEDDFTPKKAKAFF